MIGNRKAETVEHNILKHLVASLLERQGHKIYLECQCPDGSIIDVYDETDELAYEIQTKHQPEIERIKLEKYLQWAMVRDVIFIRTKDYPLTCLLKSISYIYLKKKLGIE